MSIPWPPGIFVVGTDTGVGKTRVAASVARTWMTLGRRVGVIKPVSTGARLVDGKLRSADVAALIASITSKKSPYPPPPFDQVGPLVYELPLAPPVAARRSGTPLEPTDVIRATESSIRWWSEVGKAELLVIEGVGGLLCPIAEAGWTVADLAIHLDYPLLIVARRGLGTLNHTLLTVEAAGSRGLRVAGVILNAPFQSDDSLAEESNAEELAARLPAIAILADWAFNPSSSGVAPVAPEAGNWVDLAQTPRLRLGGGSTDSGTNVLVAQSRLIGSDDAILTNPTIANLTGTSSASGSGSGSGSDDSSPFARLADTPKPDLSSLNLNLSGPSIANQSPTRRGENGEEVAVSSWSNVLLFTYASLVTLFLLWTLYQKRADQRLIVAVPQASVEPVTPIAEAVDRTNPGRLADRSKVVPAAQPVPIDRMVDLGKSIVVDSLRVEPLVLRRENLTLERLSLAGRAERRDGGKRAMVLRVRIVNQATDQVFAPVDPGFVRGRGDDVYETFLETSDGRKIYPDPLAVDSELSLVGQSFADLRPGESREVIFATGANAPNDLERTPGIWRIKLRTGLTSTAVVGVRLPGAPKP